MSIHAVIFDLDGVIVSTDELHYQAWRKLADGLSIPFSREDNERLRGVSRMESLEIVLEKWQGAPFTSDEKLAMAETKNSVYRESLANLTSADILPGVLETLHSLKQHGVRTAIGSSSKNAAAILTAIGLSDHFDAVADGTHISKSKPDPEVFLLAAGLLGAEPAHCLVVEDADAGVEAAVRAGMPVLAVGSARSHPGATLGARDLASISIDEMLFMTPVS
jgi:beta-phosphoglucomutase